jgi:hypothetical protein
MVYSAIGYNISNDFYNWFDIVINNKGNIVQNTFEDTVDSQVIYMNLLLLEN